MNLEKHLRGSIFGQWCYIHSTKGANYINVLDLLWRSHRRHIHWCSTCKSLVKINSSRTGSIILGSLMTEPSQCGGVKFCCCCCLSPTLAGVQTLHFTVIPMLKKKLVLRAMTSQPKTKKLGDDSSSLQSLDANASHMSQFGVGFYR